MDEHRGNPHTNDCSDKCALKGRHHLGLTHSLPHAVRLVLRVPLPESCAAAAAASKSWLGSMGCGVTCRTSSKGQGLNAVLTQGRMGTSGEAASVPVPKLKTLRSAPRASQIFQGDFDSVVPNGY